MLTEPKDEDLCFYAPDIDRTLYKGGIGIMYPGCYGDNPEPPFFDLAIELREVITAYENPTKSKEIG